MKTKYFIVTLILLLIIVFSGCGDSSSDRQVPSLATRVSDVFGPPGGTLTLPATGAYLYLREDSLASTNTFSLEMKDSLPQPLPGGTGTQVGSYHEITPPGLEFGQLVTFALPTVGETGISIYTYDGDTYADRGGTISGGFIFIQLQAFRNPNDFSDFHFGGVVVKK